MQQAKGSRVVRHSSRRWKMEEMARGGASHRRWHRGSNGGPICDSDGISPRRFPRQTTIVECEGVVAPQARRGARSTHQRWIPVAKRSGARRARKLSSAERGNDKSGLTHLHGLNAAAGVCDIEARRD
jgi:hypothetical protein